LKYFLASRRNSRLILASSFSLGGLTDGNGGRLWDIVLQLAENNAGPRTMAQTTRQRLSTAWQRIISGL
jgi:hypothetical protein